MAYFAPNQPEFNYLKHMFLIGWESQQLIEPDEILYYVAHVNDDGKVDDWFFDSFLSFTVSSMSGNTLGNDINVGTTMSGEGDFFAVPSPNPSRKDEWQEMLDSQLGADGLWARMDKAITQAAETLGPPPHKRNAVISVPYPAPNQCAFAKDFPNNFSVIGQNLTSASEQRLAACKWFVDETIAHWEKLNPEHLHLLGFYWLFESLAYAWDRDDHWVWKELYKYIKSRGYKMFWIPFYSSFNVNLMGPGKDFYFDAAFLQPNHMFYENIDDVEKAALEARERGAGVEMEYFPYENDRMRTMGDRHRRFKNYLDGGVKYGYMTEAACAYFCGTNELHRMATQYSEKERETYHNHYKFVAGKWTV